MSTGTSNHTRNPIDSPTMRIPVPHPRPTIIGAPHDGGRHHITATTPLERRAAHMARHILDDPEAYQRLARRVESTTPAQLGGAA